ncbi:hypothetical protein [Aquibium sp. ELW1220]|uniref:hypothetical protein n=1 Tax=Aquibium sp. ELW1220 TaxID=2976766 RepID=UPI0025B189B9|nr:hypothetical protein [Aquibium sp. ELW1220]MDN2578461.1 hypothetical protein [Aquibium sp. ELW1220]
MTLPNEKPGELGSPDEFVQLLDEIAREPVPERLLLLAVRLQEKLREQRAAARVEPTA